MSGAPGAAEQAGGGETIAALSTAPGIGAVAVVRVSGPRATEIVRTLVGDRASYDSLPDRKLALFELTDPAGEVLLDRALVVRFHAPHSYTGEDMVEIHCHGGLAVPQNICAALRRAGARTARAGEFTRRAFLNGKMDLTQAEAVDGLIHARGAAGQQVALEALGGGLGTQTEELRAELLELKAELEYSIDFPEEEQPAGLGESIERGKAAVGEALERMLEGARWSLLISRGALTVIAGEPNVGKSSLFNRLLGRERAIVTGEPGTTRDALEMETMIEGLLFRLVDTAGLRRAVGQAEEIGVEFSRRYMSEADVVLFIHEAGADFDSAEQRFLREHVDRKIIRVVNKIDLLPAGADVPEGYIAVSARTGEGIDRLRQKMHEAVMPPGGPDAGGGSRVTSNRQKSLLGEALELVRGLDSAMPREFVAADLDRAIERLEELTGRITSEDVLESIFSRFCVGK